MLNLLGLSAGFIGLIVLGVVLLLVILVAIYVWSLYNKLIKLKNAVEEGYSTMDVYLKKRYDLVPNIVNTVKGYAKHEKETLENVIAARNMAMNSTGSEKAKNENALSGTLKSLFALSENYPDLKANTNFIELQNTLKDIELEISNSRKYYNAIVEQFNNAIMTFPANMFAKKFKMTKQSMFAIEQASHRENVKVEF